MALSIFDRVGADLVALDIVPRFELDRTKGVLRSLDLKRVSGLESLFRRDPRLVELAFLHQRPCHLGLDLRRVELVVPNHEGELLVVVFEVSVRPRQRDQDARMPAPRLARGRLCPLFRFKELERPGLVKERHWEIGFPVVLCRTEHEMRDVRLWMLDHVLLGFFPSTHVALLFDELPKQEFASLRILALDKNRGKHVFGGGGFPPR